MRPDAEDGRSRREDLTDNIYFLKEKITMRNLKKFLALVLAMIMVVSAAAVVSADFTDVPADNRYAAAINDLAVKVKRHRRILNSHYYV